MSGQAYEKAKVAEAERELAEQLKAWEEKKKKEDEAAKRSWRAAVGIPEAFNPFQGAPLSPHFPKTPLQFHKGEAIVVNDKAEKVEEDRKKPSNPFEGIPLSPQFPKTPLKFYKGHVIGEPKVIVTDHDAETVTGREGKGVGQQAKDTKGDDRWYD